MKCPICNTNLEVLVGGANAVLGCPRCRYKATDGVWQELIRTRKALAFAKSKLNGIHRLYSNAFYHREDWLQVCMEMVDKANTALDKIKQITEKE